MTLILLGAVALAPGLANAHRTTHATATGVLCSDAIDEVPSPPATFPVTLGRVGLQTGITLHPVAYTGAPYLWWAKSALVIGEGRAPVTVSVAPAWRSRASITWSNRGNGPTTIEHVQSCPGHAWLAYPGGFYASTKGCIPLDITVGARHRRVWIAMGSRAGCPSR